MQRIQSGAINGLVIFLFVLIFGSFWRYFSLRYASTGIGQAMAFAY